MAGGGGTIPRRTRLRRSFASGSGRLALIGVVAVLLAVVAWAVTGVEIGDASGYAVYVDLSGHGLVGGFKESLA